ncbi:hypothetical protein GCM10022233_60190 [Streptomyces shaanxiensis]|uniref:Uncharacterized protein n=1 Tax=Streptomyces shaanxiensis TaxID=653357 RepID=A0ABP7VUE8_9ACTN
MRGARGSDWVLPDTDGSASVRRTADPSAVATGALMATAGTLVATVRALVATSAPSAGLAVAATAGGVSGRARAAAHVTPIEEARNPRMLPMVDMVVQTCPSGD